MSPVEKLSPVETSQNLMFSIQDYFKKERYAEITRAIGMHSVLTNPVRMREDQTEFYRVVLGMIKNKIAATLGKKYAEWYTDFPKIMDEVITGRIMSDNISADILAARRVARGPFKSPDEFFFWALDDRKLNLDQIVKYLEKTADMFGK